MSSAVRNHDSSNIRHGVNSCCNAKAYTSNTSTRYDTDECPSLKSFTPSTKANSCKPVTTTRLHRHGYVLYLTIIYASLAIFAWTIECVLTYRPMTDSSYTADVNRIYFEKTTVLLIFEGLEGKASIKDLYPKEHSENITYSSYVEQESDAGGNWYRLVRVLGAIASVLVIPVTSAICSKPAVAYLQHNRRHFQLT